MFDIQNVAENVKIDCKSTKAESKEVAENKEGRADVFQVMHSWGKFNSLHISDSEAKVKVKHAHRLSPGMFRAIKRQNGFLSVL